MDAGLVEDTVFGDTVRNFVQAGSRSATASVSGFFDETSYVAQSNGSGSDDAMSDRVSSGPAGLMALTNTLQATAGYAPLTLAWGGNTAGNPCFVGTILQSSYEIGDTVGELVTFAGNFECGSQFEVVAATGAKSSTQSGGFGRGFLLAPLAIYSSTAAAIGTAHDNGANTSTIGGAILNLHCTLSGTAGTGSFRVEHSFDNTTWYTIGTFDNITTSTGPLGQSLDSTKLWAGAVYRYVRAFQVSTMTGNQTVAVSYARVGRDAVTLAGGTFLATGAVGTVHDNGAATTAGAELLLNVHSASGTGTGSVIVQHSTDNFGASIVTLGTFTTAITSATTNTAETIKVTGSVNRYVRANITANTSGGMTIGVMYARN